MKNKSLYILAALLLCFTLTAQEEIRTKVLLETTMGPIEIELYNETPLHRDNFLKNVKNGLYNNILFHRVINKFMVQSGDPNSRNAKKGERVGASSNEERIKAEFKTPQFFHKKGAVAMARVEDAENPDLMSSADQFYIVEGRKYTDKSLAKNQLRLDSITGGRVKMDSTMIETYKSIGGIPYLDGQYTVFGEVTKGIDIVDKIQEVAVDDFKRPLEDIRIITAKVM